MAIAVDLKPRIERSETTVGPNEAPTDPLTAWEAAHAYMAFHGITPAQPTRDDFWEPDFDGTGFHQNIRMNLEIPLQDKTTQIVAKTVALAELKIADIDAGRPVSRLGVAVLCVELCDAIDRTPPNGCTAHDRGNLLAQLWIARELLEDLERDAHCGLQHIPETFNNCLDFLKSSYQLA